MPTLPIAADHTVYLELKLGNQVAERYGDFGALSIIAHEFGHAYMFKRNQHPIGKDGELAADAFAGGFARFAEARGSLEPGDLDEARATFASVGDCTMTITERPWSVVRLSRMVTSKDFVCLVMAQLKAQHHLPTPLRSLLRQEPMPLPPRFPRLRQSTPLRPSVHQQVPPQLWAW